MDTTNDQIVERVMKGQPKSTAETFRSKFLKQLSRDTVQTSKATTDLFNIGLASSRYQFNNQSQQTQQDNILSTERSQTSMLPQIVKPRMREKLQSLITNLEPKKSVIHLKFEQVNETYIDEGSQF